MHFLHFNYCRCFYVKLLFFTIFALLVQTDFMTRWCFCFSANDKFAIPCYRPYECFSATNGKHNRTPPLMVLTNAQGYLIFNQVVMAVLSAIFKEFSS